MRGSSIAMGAVLLLALAGGCGAPAPPAPAQPVVLWESGPQEPEFPLPPGARWAPDIQRRRCASGAKTGTGYRWACFTAGAFEKVLDFYVKRFGADAGEVRIERQPARPGGKAVVRVAQLGPSQGLPLVRLESPYPEPGTGSVRRGTLISMRWRPEGERP